MELQGLGTIIPPAPQNNNIGKYIFTIYNEKQQHSFIFVVRSKDEAGMFVGAPDGESNIIIVDVISKVITNYSKEIITELVFNLIENALELLENNNHISRRL